MQGPPVLRQVDPTRVLHRGRKLVYFGGSDYLRLSWHPEVRAAHVAAVGQQGPSACASRMTTGNLPVYGELEAALARFFGVPAVALTSSGYAAPLVAMQALAQDHDAIVMDERAHACLVDAAVLGGLPVTRFRHRDPGSLEAAVRQGGRRVLVLTDGLFTHSGEVAPLKDYLEVLPGSATLLVDDAHGVGVLGARGRGSLEWWGLGTGRCVVAATLSKAFGCYGGMVLGTKAIRGRVFERSRIQTGNTAVPPPCAAGALASVRVLQREGAARRARLRAHVARVKAALRSAGGEVADGPGPMFSVAPGTARAVKRLQALLIDAGIYPPYIRYPNGPAAAYFRFAVSSEHTDEQLQALEAVLAGFHAEGVR